MREKLTVLMTGAGAPGAPGIIRCYRSNKERDLRIVGVDMKEHVPTVDILDAFHTVPAAASDEFCDRLLDTAVKEGAAVVQSIVTRELDVLAGVKGKFEEKGIRLCCPDRRAISIANDKGQLYDHMKENGLVTPDYVKVHDIDEFTRACKDLGYPDRPICFKPTKGNGSRGFRIIDEGVDSFDLLFNEKPNSLYISMDQIQSILSSRDEMPELLVMEYMPGEEYSVDTLADNGSTIVAIPRKRLKMSGGISVDCVVENNEQIIDYCRQINRALNLDGNIGIQVRADSDGVYKILEINPRLQGSVVACQAAGVNLPYLAIKKALGEPIGSIDVLWGTEMIRSYNETFFDASGNAFTL